MAGVLAVRVEMEVGGDALLPQRCCCEMPQFVVVCGEMPVVPVLSRVRRSNVNHQKLGPAHRY